MTENDQMDTSPTPLEHPSRRRGEQRLEAIANNALLKVMQFLVTGIALPAALWGINAVINRMDRLEAQFQAQDKTNATTELRLLQTEKTAAELTAQNQALRERVLSIELLTRVPGRSNSQ